jgi:hypothetical protein
MGSATTELSHAWIAKLWTVTRLEVHGRFVVDALSQHDDDDSRIRPPI